MRRPGDNRARTRQLTSQACGETNSPIVFSAAHARPSTRRTARTSVAALGLAAAVFGGGVVAAAPAQAAVPLGQKVVAEAKTHKGKPYVYGATGPSKFDCSGFTKYVFSRFGKKLPHSSSAQYGAVSHVAKSSVQVGDLIFFKSSSGSINHVSIYAGNGKMWDAPKSGDHVRLRAIYSSNYVVGRL
jgi:cell wall-associated NlpC family hydrolase